MKAESVTAVLIFSTLLLLIGRAAGVIDLTVLQATALVWVPLLGVLIVLTVWVILNMVKDFWERFNG